MEPLKSIKKAFWSRITAKLLVAGPKGPATLLQRVVWRVSVYVSHIFKITFSNHF